MTDILQDGSLNARNHVAGAYEATQEVAPAMQSIGRELVQVRANVLYADQTTNLASADIQPGSNQSMWNEL